MAASSQKPVTIPSIPTEPASSTVPTPPTLRPPPAFPSYLSSPNIHLKIKTLCEILVKCSVGEVEIALSNSGIQVNSEDIESVLRLSYAAPTACVKFFRWSGFQAKPTPYAWNLLVDLLGKNRLFEAMWDAVRSMKQEDLLSLATFASIFSSYVKADKCSEAIMAFDIMDRYGCPQDVAALNSLLSAICRDNETAKALEFYDKAKEKIVPDADSFAILLEGWEKEGNVVKARHTFGEMIIRRGWDSKNMSAYDAFLTTLVKGSEVQEALKFLKVMKDRKCLPGMKFFENTIDILIKQNNPSDACLLWEIMVSNGVLPNLVMYNAIIELLSNNNMVDPAYKYLDEMVYDGAFPNSQTYNLIFHCLVKNKKVREATNFFHEMVKNEFYPDPQKCTFAIKMFFEEDDPEMAIEIWECVFENEIHPMEESANVLLVGLRDYDRLSEVKRFMGNILDKKIKVNTSTMRKLRNAFVKAGKEDTYDWIAKRWGAQWEDSSQTSTYLLWLETIYSVVDFL
ncbi:hypothetical protein AMTRI_Chr03g50400 [Amborella trichopoda]